jgi:hypothetical protein
MRLTTTTLTFAVSVMAMVSARQLPPPAVDPCTLVARADVEQIVSKLKAAPKSETNERVRMCTYEFASSGDQLEIWVFPQSGLDRAKTTYKDLVPVTDIGQPAFQRRDPSIGWIEIYTRKGETTLKVTMKGSGDLEKSKALARKALQKL